jgi:hypothetical protein
MEKLYNLFKFIENKYPEYRAPVILKLANNDFLNKEELNITDDIDLRYSISLKSLPKGLNVEGDLKLNFTNLKSLPEGLRVGVDLDLRGCTSLESLPEGLSVGGTLDLDYCNNLASLPEGLTVVRNLYLRNTRLTSLPKDISVGGYIDLRSTPISKKYKEYELEEMYPGIKGGIYY